MKQCISNKEKEKEKEKLKKALIEKKKLLSQSMSLHTREALNELSQKSAGEVSNMRRHTADHGSILSQQEIELQLAEKQRNQIYKINQALERIEHNNYGCCESCMEKISPKRLASFPEANLCIQCQNEIEQLQNQKNKPNFDSRSSTFTPLIDQTQKREFQ